jgi:O-6-methylguanine DNA methyltransferase
MSDLAAAPRLDELLHDHFAPGAAPDDLAARVLRTARKQAAALDRFETRLGIQATSDGVSLIRTGKLARPETAAGRRLADLARQQIAEYLAGRRGFFTVPVDLSATPAFQRRVLEAARLIPFGEARPYAWIAERIGHPHAVRAVGTALGKNPVPIIVPCHRVWRTDGGLGGYLFGGDVKRRLAELERTTPVLEGSARTRIVCRVGCRRIAQVRPDARIVFASVEDARSVGYRPCDVCAPSSAA